MDSGPQRGIRYDYGGSADVVDSSNRRQRIADSGCSILYLSLVTAVETGLLSNHPEEIFFGNNRNTEFPGFLKFCGSHILAGKHIVGFLGN